MKIFEGFEEFRKDLEILSHKTRYKILLTLFACGEEMSFDWLEKVLPRTGSNELEYHLRRLKDHGLIKSRNAIIAREGGVVLTFYTLSVRSQKLFRELGLARMKDKFRALFEELTKE